MLSGSGDCRPSVPENEVLTLILYSLAVLNTIVQIIMLNTRKNTYLEQHGSLVCLYLLGCTQIKYPNALFVV